MKILFINPPWVKNGRVGIRAGSRWPYTQEKWTGNETIPFPFFLAYSAALLIQSGFNVDFIDGVAEKISLETFWEKFKTKIGDIVVFEISTPSYPQDKQIIYEIKKLFPEVNLVLCGTHATVFPEEVLKETLCDFVLIGEYEFTILELVKKLEKKQDFKDVLGIGFKKNGEIKINPRRPLISNIDLLPYPARDITPIYEYNDWFCLKKPNVALQATRGCTFGCSFCAWPKIMYGGKNYRKRQPEKIVDEIEYLMKNYKFQEYYFDDDTFNIDINHTKAFCNEIKKRKLHIVWSFMGHTGNLTKEILTLLKEAGCEGIKFGVETGDEKILQTLNKGTTIEKTKNVFKWCKELNIRTHAAFTLGLPGETKDTLKKSIDFLLELSPDTMQVSYTTPLPGTSLFQQASKMGWLKTLDFSKYDGNCSSVMETETISPSELEYFYFQMFKKWRKHIFFREIKKNKKKIIAKMILDPLKTVKSLLKNI